MATVKPFRPLRYNAAAVGDLSTVVAPPYDVISDSYRDTLYARSPHNVVRLILNPAADRYGAAAAAWQEWRRSGVLVRDAQPALCYYVENFALPDGRQCERAGIIGAVRLETFQTGRIRPHERTFARHKEDRMKIMRACRANLSPIFGLYADKQTALDPAREVAASRAADIDLRDDAGERHRVWLLTDPRVISAITEALAPEEIVIADGHHRYETALAYRDQFHAEGQTDPEAPHNFIMMYLASMSDPGLVILPTHRVVTGALRVDAAEALSRLRRYFALQAFPSSARREFTAHVQAAHGRFGIALAGRDELLVATLADAAGIEPYVAPLAPSVRRLDVAVLDRVILRGLLDIDCTAAAQDGKLAYTHDDDSALDAVRDGGQAAFLINPPSMDEVLAVCVAGETMPEKSTYFYPKLLTGLVFHPLDDGV